MAGAIRELREAHRRPANPAQQIDGIEELRPAEVAV